MLPCIFFYFSTEFVYCGVLFVTSELPIFSVSAAVGIQTAFHT